jgi:putative endonuclease
MKRLVDALFRPRTSQQITGEAAEDHALRWLQERGLSLLERNFRCKAGEIDLILREGQTLVFVEVRQRADRRFGGAAASVTPAKQRRLLLTAQFYLQRLCVVPPCRFDVIAIEGGEVTWLKNAIESH